MGCGRGVVCVYSELLDFGARRRRRGESVGVGNGGVCCVDVCVVECDVCDCDGVMRGDDVVRDGVYGEWRVRERRRRDYGTAKRGTNGGVVCGICDDEDGRGRLVCVWDCDDVVCCVEVVCGGWGGGVFCELGGDDFVRDGGVRYG